MKNALKDLLLYDLGPRLSSIEGQLYDLGPRLLPAFLLFGVLLCFVTDFNFAGVLRRSILCLVAIGLFKSAFIGSVDFGLDIGNSLLSKDNFIKNEWYQATSVAKNGFKATKKDSAKKKEDKDKSWFDKDLITLPSFNAMDISNDFLGFFLFMLSSLSLFFVKVTFTLIYYMLPMTLPLVALVNILPISNKALEGSLLSVVWVGATPIVVSIMLEILHAIVASESIIENASLLSRSALGIIFALYLISSFTFSLKLVGSGTIGDALAGPTTAFGTGLAMTGLKYIKDKTVGNTASGVTKMFKSGANGEASPIKRMALSSFEKGNALRDSALSKHNETLDSKGITANELLNGGGKGFSAREAATMATATMANPIRSISQSISRRKLAREAVASGRGDHVITSDVLSKDKQPSTIASNGLEIKPKTTKDGKVQYPSQSYSNAITNNYKSPEPEALETANQVREQKGFSKGYRRQQLRHDTATGTPRNRPFVPEDPNADINEKFHNARATKGNQNRPNNKYQNRRDLDA